jgi:hypothetical protein
MEYIEELGRALSEAEIAALELRVGCRLPESYRNFLLKFNGGRPAPYMQVVDIENLPGGDTDVMMFFGIDRSVESSTIDWNLSALEERIGEQLLPIARDSGGNRFCINLSKNDFGSVVYCDFEPGFGFHASDSAIYYRVAPDFDSFLDRIRSLEHN